MTCQEALDAAVVHLAGGLDRAIAARLAEHLRTCGDCRGQALALERAWDALGEATEVVPSARFEADVCGALENATLRRRVVPFRRRAFLPWGVRAAALAAAAFLGFYVARSGGGPESGPSSPASGAKLALGERIVDVAKGPQGLSGLPKVANVTYRPVDPSGRIAVSFDLSTRHTIVGTPSEGEIAALLTQVVAGGAGTEGARAKAIELVGRNFDGSRTVPAPGVVRALVGALENDRNPGVRKKAAEALVGFPPSGEIRDALSRALSRDQNPGVRVLAIDGLARMATTLRDPATIETLRERAVDERETSYVRAKAATALRGVTL